MLSHQNILPIYRIVLTRTISIYVCTPYTPRREGDYSLPLKAEELYLRCLVRLSFLFFRTYTMHHSRPASLLHTDCIKNESSLWGDENYTTQSKVLPCVPWLHTWSNKYTPITQDCEDAVRNILFHTPKNNSIFLLVHDISHHRLQITVLHIALRSWRHTTSS